MAFFLAPWPGRNVRGALGYAATTLDHIDATQRITHTAIAISISDAHYMGWRTQRESEANPNRISLGSGNSNRWPVHVTRTRASLRLDAAHIIEDLIVPLRRQWK